MRGTWPQSCIGLSGQPGPLAEEVEEGSERDISGGPGLLLFPLHGRVFMYMQHRRLQRMHLGEAGQPDVDVGASTRQRPSPRGLGTALAPRVLPFFPG